MECGAKNSHFYVTHSRVEVDALGERVIALDQGKVAGAGTPLEILDSPRRSSMAQAAGFENLLSGKVTELREADGVMRVRLDKSSCEIETPLGYREVGSSVKLAIRAGDILLAIEQPRGLSARNVIAGSNNFAGAARHDVCRAGDDGFRRRCHFHRTPDARRKARAGFGSKSRGVAGDKNALLPRTLRIEIPNRWLAEVTAAILERRGARWRWWRI